MKKWILFGFYFKHDYVTPLSPAIKTSSRTCKDITEITGRGFKETYWALTLHICDTVFTYS